MSRGACRVSGVAWHAGIFVANFVVNLPLAATSWVRTQMVHGLIRKRRLERFRLLGSRPGAG